MLTHLSLLSLSVFLKNPGARGSSGVCAVLAVERA